MLCFRKKKAIRIKKKRWKPLLFVHFCHRRCLFKAIFGLLSNLYMFNSIENKDFWQQLLELQKLRLTFKRKKLNFFKNFVENNLFDTVAKQLTDGTYTFGNPQLVKINRYNGKKIKTVFVFGYQDDFVLKALNKLICEHYSNLISQACFSFQKQKGAKDAFKFVLSDKLINEKYCLKLDISNFFNSIDVDDFFRFLPIEINSNKIFFDVIKKIYLNPFVIENGELKKITKGLMAGCAITPFLTNIYLRQLDDYFTSRNITYCRYSDDIIVFDTKDNIYKHFEYLEKYIEAKNLKINEEKTLIIEPKQQWTFLGFSFYNKKIDISAVSFNKLKQKIRRMSRKYNRKLKDGRFSEDEVLYYFIKRINRKLLGNEQQSNDLCWARWYFPLINTDKTLKMIDKYIQTRLRYSVCGKFSKKNYKKVSYKRLKDKGYIPTVFVYYKYKNEKIKSIKIQ